MPALSAAARPVSRPHAAKAPTIYAARQYVTHGHFTVNGKKASIPSMRLKPGDVIGVRERSKAGIPGRFESRGKNYIVTEAVSVDEDGTLLERVITHELKQPTEVGKKWQ